MVKKDLCLIVLSHHSYSDIWDLTLNSYKKFFSANADLFITSDYIKLDENLSNLLNKTNFNHLYYPKELSWSDSLSYIMKNYIKGKYKNVIFSFDDLVLLEEVDKLKIESLPDVLGSKMDYLVLNNKHRTIYTDFIYLFNRKKDYFKLTNKDTYRGSLVFSAWDVPFFYNLISSNELTNQNPWQYEQLINTVVNSNRTFSVNRGLFKAANVIVKGSVLIEEKEKAEKRIEIKYTNNRPILKGLDEIKFNTYRKLFSIVRYLFPPSLFSRIRKILEK